MVVAGDAQLGNLNSVLAENYTSFYSIQP